MSLTSPPYPGLRPFRFNEAHLFFGRNSKSSKCSSCWNTGASWR